MAFTNDEREAKKGGSLMRLERVRLCIGPK